LGDGGKSDNDDGVFARGESLNSFSNSMAFYFKKVDETATKAGKKFMSGTGAIERHDEDYFAIFGKDPLISKPSSVGIDVKKPGKTIKWFSLQEIQSEPVYFDMTNPQLVADILDEIVPGLSGGHMM
jgi:hypothetical protein